MLYVQRGVSYSVLSVWTIAQVANVFELWRFAGTNFMLIAWRRGWSGGEDAPIVAVASHLMSSTSTEEICSGRHVSGMRPDMNEASIRFLSAANFY